VAVGLAVGIVMFVWGMHALAPVMTYALCGFVTATIVQEFWKGVRARQTIHNESVIQGLAHLIGRNRRRYGGYIVHAGIVMLFAAFAGLAFKAEYDITLKTGEAFETKDPYGHHWRFVSQGISTSNRKDRDVIAVGLETYRDGKPFGIISSEKRQYRDSQGNALFDQITQAGIRTQARQDTYVVLAGVIDKDTAELRVTFNPLVMWVWTGGFVMMIGGLIVMWPQAERRRPQAGYAAVMPPASAGEPIPAGV
jgi:cytochrome c-type biogenesis protein CcmF